MISNAHRGTAALRQAQGRLSAVRSSEARSPRRYTIPFLNSSSEYFVPRQTIPSLRNV